MKVINIHERKIDSEVDLAGILIDSLASKRDKIWPKQSWPPMKFDRPLGIGAFGGHGPIRYYVEEYYKGRSVQFRFTSPKGFDGIHRFDLLELEKGTVIIKHTLKMKAKRWALITWPVIFRPLHDACIEDALSTAEVSLGYTPKFKKWSIWVRLLRWILSGGKIKFLKFQST